MKNGRLYLIPSAIAIGTSKITQTPQVCNAVKNTSYYLAEHIREARRFISSLGLGIVIEGLDFKELSKHTPPEKLTELLQPIFNGHDLGVLSDAGCPGIADPGAEIVKAAHRHKINVIPLVGPSSIILALMASGLSGQNFRFTGYLPIDRKDLKTKINSLEAHSRKEKETQIFIETPYRNDKLILQLINTLNPSTMLTIAKDLTGSDEFIMTRSVADWKNKKILIGKTPTVFLFMAM